MHTMDWDDLRFVLAVARAGSLVRASKILAVDHTTVGRRIDAAETALGVRLFTRTPAGYVPTADADRLLAPMAAVEDAVMAVERGAQARRARLEGRVRVTSPETFGISYLAAELARFGVDHPELAIELVPAGAVLDLGRREAELAVRAVKPRQAGLVARRVGAIGYGMYASHAYWARRPLRSRDDLAAHAILAAPGARDLECVWLTKLCPKARASFVSEFSLALLAAARASAGIAILPRYLGDADPSLRHIPMPDEPHEAIWLTMHRDLRDAPRVRALADHIADALRRDASMLRGG